MIILYIWIPEYDYVYKARGIRIVLVTTLKVGIVRNLIYMIVKRLLLLWSLCITCVPGDLLQSSLHRGGDRLSYKYYNL